MALSPSNPSLPSHFIRIEARALDGLADALDASLAPVFEEALRSIAACVAGGGRVVVTGVGKSGLIARKIASTFSSTGTPAYFLHPTEALHGDLGTLTRADVILALSYSGETEELMRLLPAFSRIGLQIISFTGCPTSTLASVSNICLDVAVSEEACTLNLAPTASTTVMLALGDALALELSRRANFMPHDFADLHPGGRLGRRLSRVRDLMHAGEALPQVSPSAPMSQVINEMSQKKLGMTTVVTATRTGGLALAGIISDGDLRRLLERMGPQALERTAGDIMNRTPQTISPTVMSTEALARMEEKKITSLVVVERDQVQGVVHLHDLWHLAPR